MNTLTLGFPEGMPVRVSEYVPETVGPEPRELAPVRDIPARRGGRRTDFGRYFCRGAFASGCSKPQPQPRPGFYVVGGTVHVHPKVWERLRAGLREVSGGSREAVAGAEDGS